MKSQSLTRRAMVIVLVAELLCAVAFSGTALWHERRTRTHSLDVLLQGRVDSVLGAVQDAEDADDNVVIERTELRVPRHDVFAVYRQGGGMVGSSNDAQQALIARRGGGYFDVRMDGRNYRVLQVDRVRVMDLDENGGAGIRRPLTIVYAVLSDGIHEEIVDAARFYAVVSVVLLVVTALLMMVLLRKALAPLGELAARASAVSKGSLNFEAPESALRVRELAPLAATLSLTIDRLRRAFEHEARFVSDAAHELKTAVAVVRSTIQLQMMRRATPEQTAVAFERLLEDNQRVEELVTRMLTLARLEEHDESVSAPIDLAKSAARTLRRLAPLAEARQVSLTLLSDGVGPVRLSTEQAETLVSNLVLNAIQHSSAGSNIRVQTAEEHGRVALRVIDQGAGISAAALPHVFERFFREDRSRSRDTGGAGLGLAICKSIVSGAGGTIAVMSAPGEGATVTVEFAAVEESPEQRPSDRPEQS